MSVAHPRIKSKHCCVGKGAFLAAEPGLGLGCPQGTGGLAGASRKFVQGPAGFRAQQRGASPGEGTARRSKALTCARIHGGRRSKTV